MRRVDALCTIDGCTKRGTMRGWCVSHSRRWLLYGDPLGGRTTPGEPERFYRNVVLVDDRGPDDPCLIWPFGRFSNGYAKLWTGRYELVSRLVCQEVHGGPPSPEYQAAHLCGRGGFSCVTKSHLAWKTPTENNADKVRHGTHNRGERHPHTKITDATARRILALKGTMLQREIAAETGAAVHVVEGILSGKNWSWLDGGAS